jgi:hypothetical protein
MQPSSEATARFPVRYPWRNDAASWSHFGFD